MWDKLLDYGKQIISLTRRVTAVETDVSELKKRVEVMSDQINVLTEAVRKLALEANYDRDLAAKDREILLLRLDAKLNEFDRRLPPAP